MMNDSISMAAPSVGERDLDGHLYREGGIPVICLYGDWHQMGRQYGLLAKDMLLDVLAYIDSRLSGRAEAIEMAATLAHNLYAHYPAHHKEYLEGVSETSGIEMDRVILCNAVEYIEAAFFCSAMAVWGDYSSEGLIFGRNYDAMSYSEIARDIVLTVYHPEGQMAAATIGYAGELYCVNGFNEHLFLELNNGMPSAGMEIHWDLCPGTSHLLNLIFSAKTMDEVDHFFRTTQSCASFIISVATAQEARSYEWCYAGVHRGDKQTPEGLLVSSNHYVHPDWPFCTPTDEESWLSISRRCHLLQQAEQHKGHIDVERMQQIMMTPIEEGGPHHPYTRYQMVVVPADMTLRLRIPNLTDWAEIPLMTYLHMQAGRG